jgi:hypothetical protein
MIYLLECANRKDIIMKVSPQLNDDFLILSIEQTDTNAELEIILTKKDIFDLVGILHNLQKQMSK